VRLRLKLFKLEKLVLSVMLVYTEMSFQI